MIVRIGTRASKLALEQSRWVKGQIEKNHPEVRVELVRITTSGDRIQDAPLSAIGGKGLFVKEIEEALLQGRVDLAVHSMKDVPSALPPGLFLAVFPERENPADALISRDGSGLTRLPPGATVGTSSLRRGAQILRLRPDLRLVPLRGNVDTRLRKLDAGEVHAIVLAMAGLRRLGLAHRITQALPATQVLPAIGQGALGLEARVGDEQILPVIRFLDHKPTRLMVEAERGFLDELQGGCQVPIGGLAELKGDQIHMEGMVAELDGSNVIRDHGQGPSDQSGQVGRILARKILDQGGGPILDRLKESFQASGMGWQK